ncbi:hypothetical protein BCR44DRAFT_67015 [Catenaria anguillulae PL171]|uniref:Uncharacterized protein n=1 Tax=Catenaria anguillulae PL171 TaxID=765915 RepID=A0A1Y2HHY8_9FUNG|nr:hypothetical protein BCR44DRAFT_67015 [Catenaria anguillulae PL171]
MIAEFLPSSRTLALSSCQRKMVKCAKRLTASRNWGWVPQGLNTLAMDSCTAHMHDGARECACGPRPPAEFAEVGKLVHVSGNDLLSLSQGRNGLVTKSNKFLGHM